MTDNMFWESIPKSALWTPVDIRSSSWSGHVPFAFWIIDALRPQSLVELGTWYGMSYLAFCQAIAALELDTTAMAVDTWQGDHQTGKIAEDALASLKAAHDPKYAGFSRLNRTTFQDAVKGVADGSIDLLHVDGLHTYDAVKDDYDTWLPKMSSRGIMLFHDTQETHDDFGVYKLWAELSTKHPSFEFTHEHGLGVIAIGHELPEAVKALFDASNDVKRTSTIREVFYRFGLPLMAVREDRVREHRIAEMHDNLTKISAIPEIRASLKLRKVFPKK